MGKLCVDQLASRLVPLFKETDPNNIDEAVRRAKNQQIAEAKQVMRSELAKLFDSQIATLTERNVPEQILEILRNSKDKVLDRAESIAIAEGNLPFAPVITPLYLGYHGLVSLVRYKNKQGYTYLDPMQITDIEKVPSGLYYMFDIEDGTAMLGKKPEDADKLIVKQGRLRVVTAEVLSIGAHTDVLSHHFVDAVGSRCNSVGTPDLYLSDSEPKLDWRYLDNANARWGAASCGSRLEF